MYQLLRRLVGLGDRWLDDLGPLKIKPEWLTKTVGLLLLVLWSAACAYELPTQPTTVPIAVAPARAATQMIVKVIGPSGWYADRLAVNAYTLDQAGATFHGIVRCETSTGHLEPAQWDTSHQAGVWWLGAQVGATFACRRDGTYAAYTLTALDFEMPRGCCGGSQPSPTPKPPTTTPPTTPTKPPTGGE